MKSKAQKKREGRIRRHARVRKQVKGSANCPRLCVFRSLKNVSAQIIDDTRGVTIVGISSVSKEFAKEAVKLKDKTARSGLLGKLIAQKAMEKGVKKVCFDRGGNAYHGRVRAVAEAARKEGLEF